MYLAFPSSQYYGASVPSRCHQPAVGLAFPIRWSRVQGEATPKEFPRSSVYRLAGWVSSYTPAASHRSRRSFPEASTSRIPSCQSRWSANSKGAPSAAYGPYPSALSRWTVKGLPTLVRLLHLSAVLASPSRLMVPAWLYVVRAAPARLCTPRSDCPQLQPITAVIVWVVFHLPSVRRRLVAQSNSVLLGAQTRRAYHAVDRATEFRYHRARASSPRGLR